jgi:hypothetical protein
MKPLRRGDGDQYLHRTGDPTAPQSAARSMPFMSTCSLAASLKGCFNTCR